jgi:hypothetical protein
MTPSRIANKLRGECSYHTPIRVVLPTKKLSNTDVSHWYAILILVDELEILDNSWHCLGDVPDVYLILIMPPGNLCLDLDDLDPNFLM